MTDAFGLISDFGYLASEVELDRIADALYGGVRMPAIVEHANVLGCQFHPEKSGEAGLGILNRWVWGDDPSPPSQRASPDGA